MTLPENTNEQKVSATQDWKDRMAKTKADRPAGIGQQRIIEKVVEYNSAMDRLTLATRWRNAWTLHTADPELTQLVERAVVYFKEQHQKTTNRLRRQKIK